MCRTTRDAPEDAYNEFFSKSQPLTSNFSNIIASLGPTDAYKAALSASQEDNPIGW